MPRGTPRIRTSDNKINQIGERVQKRRQEIKVKQDELCARLARFTDGEWSPAWQDISRIEHGVRIVSDLEILALAKVLECSACWLLMGDQG